MPRAKRKCGDASPHICFLAPSAFPLLAAQADLEFIGGAELQQVLIARHLVKRGFRVSMVCLDYGQDDQVTIDGILIIRSFNPHHGIPIVRFIWPRLWSIWRSLRRANADIYYQRAAGFLTGIMAIFCAFYGRKSIFAGSANPNFERNTPKIRFRRDRWLYEYGLKTVNRIIAQNDEQAQLCKRNFGRKAIVIPSYCPLPIVEPVETRRSYILWVSMIRRIKQPELFLDLAAALPQYNFVMVGGPSLREEELYRNIKYRADTLSNLTFTGFVPYKAIDDFFQRALLFVNTSESEGFPNAFLQAWSHCVPTVSFVDSGARLPNGKSVGLQVPTIDVMIETISHLMRAEKERKALGFRSREYVEQKHAPDVVLQMYEQLFNELLAR